MEESRTHSSKLMHEFGSITNASVTAWTPVVMLDISLQSISFASSERLLPGDTHPLRFTLPGAPRMHFASVALLPSTAPAERGGYRYAAKFVTLEPNTIDHIVRFLGETA
ncbi:hypothetical protein Q4S45_11160 [Massilia sp. R2A-15]|uniref:hypothetical protein n=1 Tax=Massilia sp. R2A-15 TaxID=3064278 RepID=UPI0027344472|nr:hypothetical protein [Massilia sp. R2A-15]WLI91648.1 hypothetical protein Q4S45_11160 [Massilia sp. R2A-15]